ncbi:MAG: LysM peptidoglycan-binding domain-containing protein [Caldilinea sp. CFX5]|nr:LysM peptidoglycan-binding domain-containing protein [Caldilinea sp. CFX5]
MTIACWHLKSTILRFVALLATLLATLLTTPVQASSPVHTVQPGESLSEIAVAYGVTMSALIAENGIGNSDYIYTGQQLVIPDGSGGYSNSYSGSGGSYVTVGRGDSLSLIASLNGMTVNDLMQLNGLSNPNHVWIGQRLLVRGGGSAAAASTDDTVASDGSIHIVQRGETLSHVARRYGLSIQQLLAMNNLSNPNHVYVGQRLYVLGGSAGSINTSYAPAAGSKRITVNLSTQTLTAWQGNTVVLNTLISSGTDYTPTVTGYFRIGNKYPSQRMVGPDYDIPDVPSVMYFWQGYAFHGAYWHSNFGTPMSHGCVHLTPGEAAYLYNWADVGTEVYVHY